MSPHNSKDLVQTVVAAIENTTDTSIVDIPLNGKFLNSVIMSFVIPPLSRANYSECIKSYWIHSTRIYISIKHKGLILADGKNFKYESEYVQRIRIYTP